MAKAETATEWWLRPKEELSQAPKIGDFEGIDFAVVGKEQKVAFIDSGGKAHTVFLFLPLDEAGCGAATPGCLYVHSLAYESSLMTSCRPDSYGMQVARSSFAFVSPIVPGIRDKDAYLDTPIGAEAINWLSEIVLRLATEGLPGPDGAPRVDRSRLCVTGVSLGGALTYQLAARSANLLCGAVPVAAYHAPLAQETLAEGLAQLPVFCVHSESPTERTCPISEELPLWARIKELGGQIEVKKVHCKHGKTFSHAYETDAEVWNWLLKQRRN